MSFLSASVPRKVSDNQFIGDLMNLFERRKIKCGDPASLDEFASTLASNDAFRSQLFTLCTAISHMAAEDLSGEQLLALVARALGGPGLPKRAGVVEIPDSMRSAFLTGYDAWSNRGSEPKEPLPWPTPNQPTPTQPEQRDENATTPPPAADEFAAPKPPVRHTVQEAIDIVKERALAAAPPSPASGLANLEGLTISELKKLLEDIEHRVHRIQPQLHELTTAGRTQPDGFQLREKIREIEEAHPAAAPSSDSLADTAAASLAADPATAQTDSTPHPSRLDEAAFLARHAYLRPTRHFALAAAAAPAAAGAPAAAAPAASPSPVAAAAAAAPAPVPPSPTAALPPLPVEIIPPAAAVHPDPIPYRIPTAPFEPFEAEAPRLRITPRVLIFAVSACFVFLLIVSGLAGVLVYPSLHPKTINDYPDLKAAAPVNTAASQTPPLPASAATQLILSTQIDPTATPYETQPGRAAASKPRAGVQQPQPSSPVAVWPYIPRPVARDAAPLPAPAQNTAARRISPLDGPVSVPSATIIAYALSAPQPPYPADEPRGISGTVVVQVTISKEGKVIGIRAVSGPDELRPATVQAVQAWRFRPYLIDGAPVDVTTTLGFLFHGE